MKFLTSGGVNSLLDESPECGIEEELGAGKASPGAAGHCPGPAVGWIWGESGAHGELGPAPTVRGTPGTAPGVQTYPWL